eukprot:scaffold651_cov284-Prasinococcus_capsulatus_cf.AAC.3
MYPREDNTPVLTLVPGDLLGRGLNESVPSCHAQLEQRWMELAADPSTNLQAYVVAERASTSHQRVRPAGP